MAETYHCRPSALLGVEDPYSAWCLDEVSYTWGTSVESAVERARTSVDDAQQGFQLATAELTRLLRDPEADQEQVEVVAPGRFRDPADEFAQAQARRAQRRPG